MSPCAPLLCPFHCINDCLCSSKSVCGRHDTTSRTREKPHVYRCIRLPFQRTSCDYVCDRNRIYPALDMGPATIVQVRIRQHFLVPVVPSLYSILCHVRCLCTHGHGRPYLTHSDRNHIESINMVSTA